MVNLRVRMISIVYLSLLQQFQNLGLRLLDTFHACLNRVQLALMRIKPGRHYVQRILFLLRLRAVTTGEISTTCEKPQSAERVA